jgi:hypothetical protein
MATINRSKLVDLMIEECSFVDKNAQRKAGSKLSTQELLSVYLVFKGIIEFSDKDKVMKFRETLESAERIANGRIEGKLPCDQTGCQYRNPTCTNGNSTFMSGLCLLRPKKEREASQNDKENFE